jgi:probable addiction module antidote protein
MSKREEFRTFDVTEYLGDEKDMALYLQAMIDESAGDPKMIAVALGDVARARGMTQMAHDTGLTREALYRALSPTGNPELGTIVKVLKALGLQLSVRVLPQS